MRRIVPYMIVAGFTVFFGLPGKLTAQEQIDKEIIVVKPYQPSLSDAHKISVLPDVSDSISIRPSFDYSIRPRKFDTRFQVRPINAARMVGTPLAKLYKSYLKLGFGNYLVPLGELNINSLRDKNTQWGIDVKHYSINGKLKLDNDKKVTSGYFENSGSVYGKRVFRKSCLSGKFRGTYDGGNFYGYHPSLDTVLRKDNIRQTYLKLDGRLAMGSSHKDSLHLNWTTALDYFHTCDHYRNAEHAAVIRAEFNQRFRPGLTGGLDIRGAYYYTSASIDSANNVILSLDPWFGRTTREYTYRIGLGLAFDIHGDKTKPHIYPEALLQISLVEGILMPYFGVDGRLQANNLRTVVEENRYISPGLKVENTNHKIRGYAGFKGSFSREISYDMNASYSLVDKMPLFVNDTLDILGNTFRVIHEDLEWIQVHAEMKYQQSERFHSLLSITWDHYNMDVQAKPWHRPGLTVSLYGRYNLKNKILIDMGACYTGKRYAPATSLDAEMIALEGFVDLNLGLEYRYTRILSGFVRLNNMLGARNQTWNQYPGMGFNVLFGFTYAL